MAQSIIPDVVSEQILRCLGPDASALEAATSMTEHDISAIMIVADEDRLIGIVTERDITRRIVAAGRDPGETRLAEIMTENPETVAPSGSASYALRLMQARKCRHLPVVDEGRVVGVVSLRDLRTSIAAKTYSTDNGLATRLLAKSAKSAKSA